MPAIAVQMTVPMVLLKKARRLMSERFKEPSLPGPRAWMSEKSRMSPTRQAAMKMK